MSTKGQSVLLLLIKGKEFERRFLKIDFYFNKSTKNSVKFFCWIFWKLFLNIDSVDYILSKICC